MVAARIIPESLKPYKHLIHPLALLVPAMTASEYDGLRNSIKRMGLLMPLVLFIDNQNKEWLLDGICRLQALVENGVRVYASGIWQVPYQRYYERDGHDAGELLLSFNLYRQHIIRH